MWYLKSILFIIIISDLILTGCKNHFSFNVTTDDVYNNLFTRDTGWTGGDIASSIPLDDSTILWFFGDSWIGPVKDGRHQNSILINNAIAVQNGINPVREKLNFYYRDSCGQASSLFVPPGNNGYYWLTGSGIIIDGKLAIIASKIEKTEGDTTIWGFRSAGSWLILIENPYDNPTEWRSEMIEIPFFRNTGVTEKAFGSIQFKKDGYIYIYGTEFIKAEFKRFMVLARVPENKIDEFSTWEFYGEGKWTRNFDNAGRLCDKFGSEYSVSWHPYLRKYVTIYSENGLSDKIIMRTAGNPEGPWSEQIEVYKTPETGWDKTYFCYAAKGHQELSGKKDLLVSYVCNSTDFWKMASNSDIYRPRFIRIKLSR